MTVQFKRLTRAWADGVCGRDALLHLLILLVEHGQVLRGYSFGLHNVSLEQSAKPSLLAVLDNRRGPMK
jgi:hypothetical protein